MRQFGHSAARLAHTLGHLGDAGINGFQLGLLRRGQIEPGAREQKVDRLVSDIGWHAASLP